MNPFATALAETATDDLEQVVTKAATVGGLIALGIGVIIAIAIIWYVLQAIADWKIFAKAGEPGWKSLIPIYNIFVEYSISWSGILGLVFIVGTIVVGLVDTTNASTFVQVLILIVSLMVLVLHFLQSIKLSKCFGKGTGFGLVLFFFGPIGRLILGFGDARYIGPQ